MQNTPFALTCNRNRCEGRLKDQRQRGTRYRMILSDLMTPRTLNPNRSATGRDLCRRVDQLHTGVYQSVTCGHVTFNSSSLPTCPTTDLRVWPWIL
eukprot:729497-Rhodomonas_salina.1